VKANWEDDRHREEALRGIRGFLARRRSPRGILSGILVLTALAGFGASRGMLQLGLTAMWLRYPLAVFAAWGFFLLLVRMWAEREREAVHTLDEASWAGESSLPRSEALPGREVVPRKETSPGREAAPLPPSARERRWWEYLEIPDLSVDGEGCLVALAVLALGVALVFAIGALASLIAEADSLLAEVLLDAVLIAALYQRLRKLKPRWWVAGVMRQTRGPVIGTAVFLMVAGGLMQHYAPGAKSIGGVWRVIFGK
jgi:hypothetical protein